MWIAQARVMLNVGCNKPFDPREHRSNLNPLRTDCTLYKICKVCLGHIKITSQGDIVNFKSPAFFYFVSNVSTYGDFQISLITTAK